MITLRITKQNFVKHSFVIFKGTSVQNALNSFGFIKEIKNNRVLLWWYDNFVRSEEWTTLINLQKDYRSVYPYYNNHQLRGNIWKHSFLTLLNRIDENKGFSKIVVDKLTYKKTPHKNDNVIISNAVFVLNNNITKLEGKIVYMYKKTKTYKVVTVEGSYILRRSNFTLLPQDYFILLSIRCN
jgi:hypothetical protein